ncbi:MAG: hypothetical protein Q8O20_06985 [Sulfuricurvum sp.]|uniref:hypothetical protein n=1 Tax=Sulfuricurvum sp. TaxID=2025608 RepID=UPI00273283D8|nr:hypothetical protein [Sulfuricurvum sp.]MDP2850802.1 hypothetical protein [Sulfuricurvum sp.]
MAIPLSKVQEGCCDSNLHSYTIIDGDPLDSKGSTCDKIIECADKYILVEEKSLLLSFFDMCCKELGKDLETYKEDRGGITHLKLTDVMLLIRPMDIDVKKRIFHQTISDLLSTSLRKVSNTTHILATQYNPAKTANMPVFYLYCHSGTPIDTIMNVLVSTIHRKAPFIECTSLQSKLSTICS